MPMPAAAASRAGLSGSGRMRHETIACPAQPLRQHLGLAGEIV
jgi:hypothetical protein